MHLQATVTVKIQDIFIKYHSLDRWNLLTFHFRTVTTSGSFCPRTVEIRIEKIIQNLKQGMKKSGDVQIHKGRFLSGCFMLASFVGSTRTLFQFVRPLCLASWAGSHVGSPVS
jgi:hypothetical protein